MTNKHYVERSGCNLNNEYKSKYELENEQIEARRGQGLIPEFGHTTKVSLRLRWGAHKGSGLFQP